jgi:hypothetical protein
MRHSRLSALRRAATFATLAVGMVLAGCGDPGGPSQEEYTLRTVNNQPLPAAYPDPFMPADEFQVSGGEIILQDGGRYIGSFTVQCRSNLPEGTTCTVDEPEQVFEGAYSRAEGWMEIGSRRYPAVFENAAVSVRIFIPAYLGYYPEYNLRFTR